MSAGSFARYLAQLDEEALTRLIEARPDVRVQPVPETFEQLAERLGGAGSLADALLTADRDAVVVGEVVAALGDDAGVPAVARLLGTSVEAVREAVAGLCGRGLAWTEGDRVHLPLRLAAHWAADLGGGRPVATVARSVLVDELRVTAQALGVAVDGLRKPELIGRIAAVMADWPAVARIVAGLAGPARERLGEHRNGSTAHYFGYPGGGERHDRVLATAGLLLRVFNRWELPREVAIAAWLADTEPRLTGRPRVDRVEVDPAVQVRAARAEVGAILNAVTALLDEARATSVPGLKKGGIGVRERARLAARLSLPGETMSLVIDLAHAAGLFGLAEAGYAPTGAYQDWRAAEPGVQWAALAVAWFRLEHAPTCREVDNGKEQPPPLPLVSGAGRLRRALLGAVAGGESVAATAEQIDWFVPLHGYEPAARKDRVGAAVREAELLGVVACDRITDLGRHLLATAGSAESTVDALAELAAPLLPPAPCTVILQSDLTAVVSGRPGIGVSRLLSAAAVGETRGTAAVWRFTPASIRAALDAGWTAAALLAELAALTDRPLPQPLQYLISDVARRHGAVRVRGMRSCVLADETTITELLHTRSLQTLHLARLAPTVLSSPFDLDAVLTRLRAAGLCPVAEDALGAVIVESATEHEAPDRQPAPRAAARLQAPTLARRLRSEPDAQTSASATGELLASLGARLDDAELRLLSHAVDHEQDVRIEYRDKTGKRTIREIRPQQIYGRWLDSWCHLRNAQRDFAIANIESVSPIV